MLDKPTDIVTLTAADLRIRQLGRAMFDLGEGCTREQLRMQKFSDYELDTYGDAARSMAEKLANREIGSSAASDEQLIAIGVSECAGLVSEGEIFATLRRAGLTTSNVGRLWPKIMIKLASAIATMPTPEAKKQQVA